MTTPGWYLRRLGAMSAGEIRWRAVQAGRMSVRRLTDPVRTALPVAPVGDADVAAFRQAVGRPVVLDRGRAAVLAAAHPREMAEVLAAADRAADLRFAYFGCPEVRLDDPPDWHRDAISGHRWPVVRSERIDHRRGPGDPKWIWELNRLQHLPWLAQAWLVTGHRRYADAALDQLDSWIAANPPGFGIAWRGPFEVGIRAISVALAVQGLRDAPGLDVARYRRILALLGESARRCWSDRSRFSSANNHLVGELAGLVVVALLFPELTGAARWAARGLQELEIAAGRLILPDGAGAEQAIAYQVFTTDLLAIVAALVRLRGQDPPPGIVDAVRRNAAYLGALGAPTPTYGDDDDGFAVRLGAARRDMRSRLGTDGPDLTAAWLAEPPPTPTATRSFHAEHGGLVALRTPTRRTIMDIGPLGHGSLAAHGHADALAVGVDLDGHTVVGDPGTASYFGRPPWRAAHRGTRVHATLCLDGQDQSVPGGPFLWSRHAAVTVHQVDLERGIVVAEHDGYLRLAAPAVHRRWLHAPPRDATVLVVDLVEGAGRHVASVSWPLHPDLDVEPVERGHVAVRDGRPVMRLGYAATRPVTVEQVRGDPATHLGWWSMRLESRQPAWLVGARVRSEGPTVIATILHAGGDTHIADLRVGLSDAVITTTWTEGSRTRCVTMPVTGTGRIGERPGT